MNISKIAVVGSSCEGYKIAGKIFGNLNLGKESSVILIPHIFPGAIYSYLKRHGKNVYPILVGQVIEPGNIYIGMEDPVNIPLENNNIGIKNRLKIEKIKGDYKLFFGERTGEASVDKAFYEVAKVFKEKGIGVILYGAGDDGVIGMRKIKEVGGKTFVQQVDMIKDKGSMPWHTIKNCKPDYVLSPDKLKKKLEEMLG